MYLQYCSQPLCIKVTMISYYSTNQYTLDQGLSKHQKVCFTRVTKIPKFIVVFWDLFDALKKLILKDKYQTDHEKNW